ncbi:hypothetical protein AJ78_04365 [Emergomyces pasteurianus Ep9510]|uniref:Uncharacterized protein n=1 Tax=Emergomyces pasteurianus Ep9510 TaxID=1447872 RepID=A0A1J9PG16_9EURO|nr:hypothetical protein AJ78_04365 [Emergomyces pasteurianus Ep9510]
MKLFSIYLGLAAITQVLALVIPSKEWLLQADMIKNAMRLIPNLKEDLSGVLHLGDDGILRSFNGDGLVIDYARFDQAQLQAVISWYSGDKEKQKHLQQLWMNIDSSLITEEQILHPPQHLLPAFITAPRASLMSSAEQHNPLKLFPRFCTQLHCQIQDHCFRLDPLCPRCFAVDSFPHGDCLPR